MGLQRLESSGLTVRQLKEIVKDWPDTNQYGEDTEVWLITGKGLTTQADSIAPLNLSPDGVTEKATADLLIGTSVFDGDETIEKIAAERLKAFNREYAIQHVEMVEKYGNQE